MAKLAIELVQPPAGVEGGEVVILAKGFDFSTYDQAHVTFGGVEARIIGASSTRIIAPVPPDTLLQGTIKLALQADSVISNSVDFLIGKKIAENLHPVANPAFDRDTGAIYTTLSGTRGQKVPVSVFKITPNGENEPFVTELVNPTGLAFNPDGELFVTSRYDGSVYRVNPFKEAEVFAMNLGTATGIAFDKDGRMYVGDRDGTIYRVNETGGAEPFASMEPSVAAFHLAFGPDGCLYTTGPTASSFESVYRINTKGEVTRFFTGLGRPQGLAFDAEGNLYLAASRRGQRGIVKINPNAEDEMAVAGNSFVGLCFNDGGDMIIAATSELYQVPLGIKGFSPF